MSSNRRLGRLYLPVLLVVIFIMAVISLYAAYSVNNEASAPEKQQHSASNPSPEAKKVIAVGDIACDTKDRRFSRFYKATCQDDKTHALAASMKPDAILALGDLQYDSGSLQDFKRSYDAYWGRDKAITFPVPGNHEYATPGASGYFGYFNGSEKTGRAGEADKGYYSTRIGSWQVLALNSNCAEVGGCGAGSRQLNWLEQELSRSSSPCTLAFWHHPRFTSGYYANNTASQSLSADFWNLLLQYKADLVVNGHDHLYERFAPQDADGQSLASGIRQFTAGTGGRVLYRQRAKQPNSQKVIDDQFGVLVLELYPLRYNWQFISTSGAVLDSGTQDCVN